jgi:hypothetical protein
MSEKSLNDLFPDATTSNEQVVPPADPLKRIRAAVVKLRSLRTQVGHDGLTPAGARTLLEEVAAGLEACAAALERRER